MLFVAKSRANKHQTSRPDLCVLCVNGQSIEYVDKYVHLGHVISAYLSGSDDIQRCRSTLVGQINKNTKTSNIFLTRLHAYSMALAISHLPCSEILHPPR